MEVGAPLILTGSARSDGNTAAVVARLKPRLSDADVIDLAALDIAPFDYARPEREDDFKTVIEAALRAQDLVFATPVYWYAMSGPMKLFFDRLSDLLLTPEGRRRGRALAGKRVWVLATGADPELPPGFSEPFRLTAAYFDMTYGGACYVPCPEAAFPLEEALSEVDAFAARIAGEPWAAEPTVRRGFRAR